MDRRSRKKKGGLGGGGRKAAVGKGEATWETEDDWKGNYQGRGGGGKFVKALGVQKRNSGAWAGARTGEEGICATWPGEDREELLCV